MSDNKYQYLTKNTALFGISSFGSKIIVFLLVPLYTKVLTPSEYGTADIIYTTATLLSYVFTINIADGVLRFGIDNPANQSGILSYAFKVLSIGSLILAISLIPVIFLRVIPWNQTLFYLLFALFFSLALNNILTNYLRAIDKVKEVAVSGIIQTIATVLSNILLLLVIKLQTSGFLASIFLGGLFSSVYCFYSIRRSPKVLFASQCPVLLKKEICAYSIPLIFNGIAWWCNSNIDKYFVTGMLGTSENGIISVSYKIPMILTTFHTVFAQAWNLSAFKEYKKENYTDFFSNIYEVYNTGLIITCSIIILFNITIAKILYLDDFFVAWKYSSILLISTLFSCLSGVVGSVFSAAKDSRFFAISTILALIVNIVLNYILIKQFNLYGAAISTAASFFFVWIIRLIYTKKFIQWKINYLQDSICYTLLVLQIFFEHTSKYSIVLQIIILIAIALIKRNVLLQLFSVARKVIPSYLSKKDNHAE